MNLTNLREDADLPGVRSWSSARPRATASTVLESEIVGLVPQAALLAAAEYYLQIEGFSGDQVLENRLR